MSPLHKVYVDLSGPYSVTSRSGHKYCMNIIDDYSSFAWCIPIAAKDDALNALMVWHRSVEKQSSAQLKVFLTNNGELISNACRAWCDAHGIVHQRTGPYTSIQNGHVERLHHTLLHKARTMRITCDASLDLWHEFCLTAAYLTNYTASDTLDGHTPHELWFGKQPSLSHLREIGCSAYSLLHKHPKVFARSISAILIGYALNSRSYRLWDREADWVFDSYHVVFVEHLDSKPRVFRPGVIIPAIPPPPLLSSPQTPLHSPLPILTQITTQLPPMPHVSLPPQPPSLPIFPSNYHNFSLSNPPHSVPTMPNPLFVPAFPYLPVFPPMLQNTPAGLLPQRPEIISEGERELLDGERELNGKFWVGGRRPAGMFCSMGGKTGKYGKAGTKRGLGMVGTECGGLDKEKLW
jgi:Integrase core domain